MDRATGCILVVDDDPINRKILSRSLEGEGHLVRTADDGSSALEILRDETVDIVLLDVLMPGMDGVEVLKRMKADTKLKHLPVIVISALEEMDTVVRCIEMGAEDYLSKPFDRVLLRARLNAALTKKRFHDLELEYIEQVGYVTAAAAAVEGGTFEPRSLDVVAKREDALGRLAQIFRRMAIEVEARAERLRREVKMLRIEIDESRAAKQVMEITETDYFQKLQQKVADLRLARDESRAD
jgi:two-component system, cell cycle response regulator